MTPTAIIRKGCAGEPTELVAADGEGKCVVVPLDSLRVKRLIADLINADLMDELKALSDGKHES